MKAANQQEYSRLTLDDIYSESVKCGFPGLICLLFHRKYRHFIGSYDAIWHGCDKCKIVWSVGTESGS